MNVGKRMSFPLVTVAPDLPVPDALALINKAKIRHILVVEKNKLVGIITKNDLLNASPSRATTLSVWEINYLVSKITVADVMAKGVITTTEDTPIEEAAHIMNENQISCLPVMRNGDVVGIITESDLFKIFLELLGANRKGVRLSAEVHNAPGVLAKLAQTIYEAGGNIVALGAFAGETLSTSDVMIKLEDIDLKAVEELVRPLVNKILDIRVS